MKELVAVAPDGSLEVWTFVTFYWINGKPRGWKITIQRSSDAFRIFYDHDMNDTPEFWGRETLGEL